MQTASYNRVDGSTVFPFASPMGASTTTTNPATNHADAFADAKTPRLTSPWLLVLRCIPFIVLIGFGVALTAMVLDARYWHMAIPDASSSSSAMAIDASVAAVQSSEFVGRVAMEIVQAPEISAVLVPLLAAGVIEAANMTLIPGPVGEPGLPGSPGAPGSPGEPGQPCAPVDQAGYWSTSQAVVTAGSPLSFFGQSAESGGITQTSASTFYLEKAGRYLVSYRSDTYEATSAAGLCLTTQNPLPTITSQLQYYPQSAVTRLSIGTGASNTTVLSTTCFLDVPSGSTLRLVAIPVAGTRFTPLNTHLTILAINVSGTPEPVPPPHPLFNAANATVLFVDRYSISTNGTMNGTAIFIGDAAYNDTLRLEPNVNLAPDETPPTADPYGRVGMHYRSPGAVAKINWYYVNPGNMATLFGGQQRNMSSLYAVWHTLTLYSTASVPYLIIYTKPTASGTPNAASWYKSRRTYTIQSAVAASIPIGTPVVLYLGAQRSAGILPTSDSIPTIPSTHYFPLVESLTAQGSLGPRQPDEEIMLVSIQTNSNDAFARASFTLHRVGIA